MKEINEKAGIQIVLKMVCSIILAIILASTVFAPFFSNTEISRKITIIASASKNSKSWGTDVRIRNVKVDGEIIPFSELEKDEAWEYLDDLLVVVNPQQPARIYLETDGAKNVEVSLQKHEGSGIVEIYADEHRIGKMDLYSPGWEEVTLKKSLMDFSISNNIGLFLVLLIVSGWFVYLVEKVWINLKSEVYFQKLKFLYGSGFIILGVGAVGFHEGQNLSFILSLLVIAIIFIYYYENKLSDDICFFKQVFYNMILLLITAACMLYVVENANNNLNNLNILYLFGNISIYYMALLVLFVISRKVVVAAIIGMLMAMLYGVANYYVLIFRGSPIVPGDFFTLGTAKSVMFNYQYDINWSVFSSVVFGIFICVLFWLITHKSRKLSRRGQIFGGLFLVTMFGIIGTLEFYKPSLDFWNLNNNTRRYGHVMSMVSNIRRMKMTAPEGYSEERLEELSLPYISTEMGNNTEFTPNVVVVMNESFSDLSILSDALDSDQYMPYYNNMSDNVIKGVTLVSTIGGGTSNSEYEFLTGNSMGFMPGTIPYQQFVLSDSFSLARILGERGYSTIALHPYDKRGYNRTRVYPFLGFDEFISVEDFENPELSRNRYVTDAENYRKVIEIFEQYDTSGPLFLFNVTMQNHSGYTTNYFEENVIQVPNSEGVYPDVEEYLTLIKESDDALHILIEYFEKIEEPTVVVMFGDHQPKIDDKFYEDMVGKPISSWPLEDQVKRFEVPFFIWANYDINEQADVFTSLNYLSSIMFNSTGIEMIPYQKFLLEASKRVPAMNINGYLGADGVWYTYSEDSEYKALLDDYWKIQYSNVFDDAEGSQWFVTK